jgi:hypothetical protein
LAEQAVLVAVVAALSLKAAKLMVEQAVSAAEEVRHLMAAMVAALLF